MENIDFLKRYQHLQYEIMYNHLIDLGFSSVAIGNTYDSPFFNHAQANRRLVDTELSQLEAVLIKHDRKPAVYFENREDLQPLVDFLTSKGYKKVWEDSWMFHNGANIGDKEDNNVKKVYTETELKVFLTTFDACYQKDDPQNPYGELGNYLDVAKESWHRHNESDKIEYFIVFDGKNPVAVSTLTNFAGMGYISNVGSLKDVRGKGFGKLASLYCVMISQQNGNDVHALATEEGHYPNEFYQRIGFGTKFTAVGYVKN